jgi:hypothetical protein
VPATTYRTASYRAALGRHRLCHVGAGRARRAGAPTDGGMDMRILAVSLGLLVIASQGLGCIGAPEEPGAGEPAGGEHVGVAAAAQLDGGSKTYTLTQTTGVTAMAWAGTVSSHPTEYWVANTGYASTATRTFTEASQTCSGFRDVVCGSGWSGATFYRAEYTETTLDCDFPPGPCTPPSGDVSFLGTGSYTTSDASGAPFAWTFAHSGCEYWAMNNTISTGSNTQSCCRTQQTAEI